MATEKKRVSLAREKGNIDCNQLSSVIEESVRFKD
jgi:hypothetical protein